MAKKQLDITAQQGFPVRVISKFKEDTLRQFGLAFKTQRVFPYEPYPGYLKKNEQEKGDWKSTGRGIRSFEGEVLSASEDEIAIRLSYLAYLDYVNVGVGRGRFADDVVRQRDARYNRRYTSKWMPRQGFTHRPITGISYRHLARRMENFMMQWHGKRMDAIFDETLTIDNINIL